MSKSKSNVSNILSYLLLFFIAALMVVFIYTIVTTKLEGVTRIIGAGVSLTGILGFIMVLIFKGQLDAAENKKEKIKILKFLLSIFKISAGVEKQSTE